MLLMLLLQELQTVVRQLVGNLHSLLATLVLKEDIWSLGPFAKVSVHCPNAHRDEYVQYIFGQLCCLATLVSFYPVDLKSMQRAGSVSLLSLEKKVLN